MLSHNVDLDEIGGSGLELSSLEFKLGCFFLKTRATSGKSSLGMWIITNTTCDAMDVHV